MTATVSLDAIPHRDPFRLVDEVVDVESERISTKRFVDPESDFFNGHYPGQPVMPGVLICESCFQTGALLIAHRIGSIDTEKGVPVLTRIQDARFRQMVRPGDTLEIKVELDDELEGAYYMTGRVTVGGKAVLRVSFVCMMAGA